MNYKLETISLPKGTGWDAVLKESYRKEFEAALPAFLKNCRWFGGKARKITEVRVISKEFLPWEENKTCLLTLAISYEDDADERYLLPLSFRFTDALPTSEDIMIATRLRIGSREGLVYDASGDPGFMENCLRLVAGNDESRETQGNIRGMPGEALRDRMEAVDPVPEPRLLRKEQSNTSFIYGDRYILKLYRRRIDGINPEVEVIRFLTEEAGFPHIAPFTGLIEERTPGSPPVTLALLQSYVEHTSDAWTHFLETARECFVEGIPEFSDTLRNTAKVGADSNQVNTRSAGLQPCQAPAEAGLKSCTTSMASPVRSEWIEKKSLEEVKLLGKRSAQLHQALASKPGIPAFAPKPYSLSDREEQLRSSLSLLEDTLRNLKNTQKNLPPEIRDEARRLRERKTDLIDGLRQIENLSDPGMKIRIHGDYHLGQILCTEDDFVIIDFEGEPARSSEERRQKRSPLIDVAGMIRSFHYAAYGAIFLEGDHSPEKAGTLSSLAEEWYHTMSATFLKSYLETISREKADLLPAGPAELNRLLEVFLLEKAIYELNYELNNRPEWVIIPLRGISALLQS